MQWHNLDVGKVTAMRLDSSLIPFKDGYSQKPPGQTLRGYSTGVITRPNIAYNLYGNPAYISSDTPFNLCSLYVTAAYYNNVKVTFTPYIGLTPGDPEERTISAVGPTLITLNFVGVSKVVIDSQAGNPYRVPSLCPASKEAYPSWQFGYDWKPPRCGCHVVLDNLSVDLGVAPD